MIADYYTVLMTESIKNQLEFYQGFLGLEIIFNHNNALGLGRDGKLFVILRQYDSEQGHHHSEHKGPLIMSFKWQGSLEDCVKSIKNSKFVYRDTVTIIEHEAQYLFIEDADGNEVCLDLSFSHG